MILQCDQCNTKFKLDDAKIKEGGVKVRCSKCKHVFLVTKDAQNETDFDSILDGLDAPAPVPAAAAAVDPGAGSADADIAAPQVDFSHLKHAIQASETEAPAQPAAEALDFGSFKFDDDQDDSLANDAGEAEKSYDLSGFDPDDEASFAADEQVDTGDIAFGETAVPEENSFAMSEFSFADGEPESVPAVKADEIPSDPLAYNDFTFSEEAPVSPGVEAEPASPGEFDFSEFSFDAGETKDEQTSAVDAGSAASNTELDFGSFDFEQVEEPPNEPTEPAGMPDLIAAGGEREPFASPSLEFDLVEEGATEQRPVEISTAAGPEAEPPGEFSFDFGAPEEPLPETAPILEQPVTEQRGGTDLPEFTFGEFAEEAPTELATDHKDVAESPVMQLAGDGDPMGLDTIDFGQVASPVVPADEPKADLLFNGVVDNDVKQQVPPDSVTEADFQDEYPPLSISSRRKGRSSLSFAGIGVIVLVLLALAGTGLYFIKSKPEIFNKLGLGALAQGLGVKSAEDGRITIKNPVGAFVVNKEAGELFVITGSAVNEYKKPRASIQVKATLFGKDGKPVMQKVVYCGNNLSREQLVSMPLDKLETAMNNQFGDSLSNLGVQPGKEIPFVVILSKVPQDVGEFGVEVVGSTVAAR